MMIYCLLVITGRASRVLIASLYEKPTLDVPLKGWQHLRDLRRVRVARLRTRLSSHPTMRASGRRVASRGALGRATPESAHMLMWVSQFRDDGRFWAPHLSNVGPSHV